jgi:hypothetical protein
MIPTVIRLQALRYKIDYAKHLMGNNRLFYDPFPQSMLFTQLPEPSAVKPSGLSSVCYYYEILRNFNLDFNGIANFLNVNVEAL